MRIWAVGAVVMAVGLCAARASGAQTLALGGPPLVRLGALDSPIEEVFGRIQDVAVGPLGDVFVLDGIANDLRWFDAAGHFRGKTGRSGKGPGELSVPVAAAVDESGLVHILDASNRRIAVFAPTQGGLQLQRENRVPFAVDLCIAGSRRYLLLPSALGGGSLIHEINDQGSTIGSFAEPDPKNRADSREWGRDAATVASSYERGSLACDAGSGMIVLLSETTPSVRAFSLEGGGLWRAELPDYHARSIERTERGAITMRPDPSTGTAHTGTAVLFSGDFVFVVLHEGSMEDPEGKLELRVLRREDGEEVSREALSSRLVAQRAGRIVGVAEEPYPVVLVYGMR